MSTEFRLRVHSFLGFSVTCESTVKNLFEYFGQDEIRFFGQNDIISFGSFSYELFFIVYANNLVSPFFKDLHAE